jgi:hypothetical protein
MQSDQHMRDEIGAASAQREVELTLRAPFPSAIRYISRATIYRRASEAEIDTLEAWLDNGATPRQRVTWRDAEGGPVRVDEMLPLATTLFGARRAAELLE